MKNAVLGEEDLLAIVVRLQDEVRTLAARVESNERAGSSRGAVRAATASRVSLEEAGRLGLLPRSSRTIRKWMASGELRTAFRPDIFVKRIGARYEVDLAAVEEWRRAMAAPATPTWPKSFGRRPS